MHPQTQQNASAEPSAEAESKSRPQSTDRELPPAVLFSVLHCRHQTRRPQAETVRRVPAVHPLSDMRRQATPFCEAVFRREKADNTDISLPEGVSQPFPSRFPDGSKARQGARDKCTTPPAAHIQRKSLPYRAGRPMRRTLRAARMPGRAERARSGVPSGAVKFCHFLKTCVTLPFPVFLPAP